MQLPIYNGITASTVQLPQGSWNTVLDCLCAQFTAISYQQWLSRMQRGRVLDAQGQALGPTHPYRAEMRVHYYREVPEEIHIPFVESILHLDAHLLVVDKPHFLPVTPSGRYVEETLLARLIRRGDNPHLVPLHRIDRGTAGVVLFSTNPASRARYQALFRDRLISKRYEAIAGELPALQFPLTYTSCLVAGEPFIRMQESDGVANTETRIDVIARAGVHWRYALHPITGKKHQLRVHMAALGAPICNDDFYPSMVERAPDDYTRPLKLLAQRLEFLDPLDGAQRCFESQLTL